VQRTMTIAWNVAPAWGRSTRPDLSNPRLVSA
jgi:hypothetical protein